MYKFGDIVLVPFPFTDLENSKVRPALVLSRKASLQGDFILCFLSSQIDEKTPKKMILSPSSENGLKNSSWVRFDKIATLQGKIILGSIGKVSPLWLKGRTKDFQEIFGFEA